MLKFLKIVSPHTSGRNSTGHITVRHRGSYTSKNVIPCFATYRLFKSFRTNTVSIRYQINNNFFYLSPFRDSFKVYRFRSYDSSVLPRIFRSNFKKDNGVISTIRKLQTGQYISQVSNPHFIPKFSRAYGSASRYLKRRGSKAIIRLPSGEVRKISVFSFCIPTAIFKTYAHKKFYKAGQNRNLGVRPRVRGVAMNPVDHPHGGRTGESRPSVSPWAILTKGYKTRLKPINRRQVLISVRDFKYRKIRI
jgi:large subunit ribosomal protein L2